MNHLSDLPTELYPIIIKYATIRCVYHLTQINKRLNQLIGSKINQYIYVTINKNNTLDNIKEGNKLFSEKTRYLHPNHPNLCFSLQNDELIIYKRRVETKLILITMSTGSVFTMYTFESYIDKFIFKFTKSLLSIKNIMIPSSYFNIQNYNCECHTSLGGGQCADCCNNRNSEIKKINRGIISNILNNDKIEN